MDSAQVQAALKDLESNPKLTVAAKQMRANLEALGALEVDDSRNVSVMNSDMVGVAKATDYLDITQDVKTLAAVMIAEKMTPPLAIGLFGAWGSGRSFYGLDDRGSKTPVRKSNETGKRLFLQKCRTDQI